MGKDSKDSKDAKSVDPEDIPEPADGGAWFGDATTGSGNWFGTVEPAAPEE